MLQLNAHYMVVIIVCRHLHIAVAANNKHIIRPPMCFYGLTK